MNFENQIPFAPGLSFEATIDSENIGEKEVVACFQNPENDNEVFVVFCDVSEAKNIAVDVLAGVYKYDDCDGHGILLPVEKPKDLEYIQKLLNEM